MRKLDAPTADAVTATESDDLITIEAPTVEEAMARLADEVGEDARIVSAEKAARGGLGGFFAKEMVVLTARRPETDQRSLPGVLERMSHREDANEDLFGEVLRRELADHRPSPGLGNLLDAAGWTPAEDTSTAEEAGTTSSEPVVIDAADTEADTTDPAAPPPVTVGPMVTATPVPRPATAMPEAPVAQRLAHEHLVAMPPEPSTAGVIHVPGLDATGITSVTAAAALANGATLDGDTRFETTATAARSSDAESAAPTHSAAPAGRGAPRWAIAELVRNGLPDRVVNAVRHLDPTDDLAWMSHLAAAVAPWCGALPGGDQVIVGPGAERMADMLDLPLVRLGDVAPYAGSFCSELTGADDDRAWLEFVRGDRTLHFVLGEDELWRDLLVAEPAVVSWASRRGLIDALYLASTMDAVLGYGSLSSTEGLVRAQPVDVALGIRRIVGRQ